jgi:hypothetical protein
LTTTEEVEVSEPDISREDLAFEGFEEMHYRLNVGLALYVTLGSILVIGLGVVFPLWFLFDMGLLWGMGVALIAWSAVWTPFVITRKVLGQHVVYRWCTKNDFTRTQWMWQRETFMKKMPPHTRWFAKYVDRPVRVKTLK